MKLPLSFMLCLFYSGPCFSMNSTEGRQEISLMSPTKMSRYQSICSAFEDLHECGIVGNNFECLVAIMAFKNEASSGVFDHNVSAVARSYLTYYGLADHNGRIKPEYVETWRLYRGTTLEQNVY